MILLARMMCCALLLHFKVSGHVSLPIAANLHVLCITKHSGLVLVNCLLMRCAWVCRVKHGFADRFLRLPLSKETHKPLFQYESKDKIPRAAKYGRMEMHAS